MPGGLPKAAGLTTPGDRCGRPLFVASDVYPRRPLGQAVDPRRLLAARSLSGNAIPASHDADGKCQLKGGRRISHGARDDRFLHCDAYDTLARVSS